MKSALRQRAVLTPVCLGLLLATFVMSDSARAGDRIKVLIESTMDQAKQPCYVVLPGNFDPDGDPVPLLVSLHSWSANLEQRRETLEAKAEARGWISIFPNFRGRNDHPEACGSLLAQQDILDAVAWAQKKYPVDEKRIYLMGVSGGGHMTMLMVGRHPQVWAAASAWVGISDLAAWHKLHDQRKSRYALMMRACCGGAPGASAEVNKQYRDRSPINFLHRAVDVPLDIAAGVHDGHKGSVPIHHSLNAFNAIAGAAKAAPITEQEIQQISRPNGRLKSPRASDTVSDDSFGRAIYLRRSAGKSRVTIFEGGHEGIETAAMAWLERHSK